MSEKLFLDAVIDPLAATVIVEGEGSERTARFDIAGVPRVDKLLVGKRASEVPTIVTRLCGLCPVTHHLACLLYTSPSPRDISGSRMPSSA